MKDVSKNCTCIISHTLKTMSSNIIIQTEQHNKPHLSQILRREILQILGHVPRIPLLNIRCNVRRSSLAFVIGKQIHQAKVPQLVQVILDHYVLGLDVQVYHSPLVDCIVQNTKYPIND